MLAMHKSDFVRFITGLHFHIHDSVRDGLSSCSSDFLSTPAGKVAGDVSYRIDIAAEDVVDRYFHENLIEGGVVVICEGLGEKVYPPGLDKKDARYFFIIDPLDGTREIMYDKRSCWILTGLAYNGKKAPNARDIFLSVQTEVPPTIQQYSSVLTAWRGKGAFRSVWDIKHRVQVEPEKPLRVSGAVDLRHGFAVFTNFFPGMKEIISRFEEAVLKKHLGDIEQDEALVFTDQYISSAGQLYLLASGKYRFVADIRAFVGSCLQKHEGAFSLCCHPYDLSSYLIFTEAGGILTNLNGEPADFPLDLETDCAWFAYSSEELRRSLEPVIKGELKHLSESLEIRNFKDSLGIEDRSAIMPNGELRIRTTDHMGCGFVLCVAPRGGAWQKAHYHDHINEIVVVKEGFVALIFLNGEIRIYGAGESFTVEKCERHNIYMYSGAVTYTLKYNAQYEKDWHADEILDSKCGLMGSEYMESLIKPAFQSTHNDVGGSMPRDL
jgi:fructose-1,6-bisphosphatase/inositol monophosphatase family enzyme